MLGLAVSRAPLRTLAIAALAAVPILIWSACGGDPGTTPECVSDVTANGITPVKGGCSGFAVCQEDPANPMTCCADRKTPADVQACLFLYGAAPAPNNFGAGGGSSSSSSSGSSSSGMKDGG
jgi:hypothetical protein